MISHQPKKEPHQGKLTSAEKEVNREIAQERMIIEHHIGGKKRSTLVHDIFCNHKVGYDDLVIF